MPTVAKAVDNNRDRTTMTSREMRIVFPDGFKGAIEMLCFVGKVDMMLEKALPMW